MLNLKRHLSGIIIGSGLWACALSLFLSARISAGDHVVYIETQKNRSLKIDATTEVSGNLMVYSSQNGFLLAAPPEGLNVHVDPKRPAP